MRIQRRLRYGGAPSDRIHACFPVTEIEEQRARRSKNAPHPCVAGVARARILSTPQLCVCDHFLRRVPNRFLSCHAIASIAIELYGLVSITNDDDDSSVM